MRKSLLLFILVLFTTASRTQEIRTISPDGIIEISLRINSSGIPYYSITYRKERFLEWSKLGLELAGSGSLLNGAIKVVSTERKLIDETYPVISGKSKYSRNYCNETKILLEETSGQKRKLEIYSRAYNDGAAFRYGIPKQEALNDFVITREASYFNFAGNYTCWAMKKNTFRQNYEGEYRKYEFSTINNSPGDSTSKFTYITLPLTVEVNKNLYVCLSEANITNYSAMYLVSDKDNSFKSVLAPDLNDASVLVRGNAPSVSPWRFFIVGETPGGLIESNLVMNLNDPLAIPDAADWVKPGKSLWSWWNENRGYDQNAPFNIISTDFIKSCVDFAASNNTQYYTIDAGCYSSEIHAENEFPDLTKPIPECDLLSIAEYSNSKNVGIFIWVLWNELDKQMDKALDYYNRIGVKGIKIDFMDRDDQQMVDFYHKLIKACAERKLMVNFHGAYKPDGISRTYPNAITREAVLGNEYSKFESGGLPTPIHTVTLPFTRMVVGPMDYTPGSMIVSTNEAFIGRWKNPAPKGTRANQLAMLVVFESGLQTLCESPKILENLPEFEFIKEVPATWDSTIVLEGVIGEYIVIARKKDNNWYIGAMTNWDEREIEIDFGFMDREKYTANIFQDAEDANLRPEGVKVYSTSINRTGTRSFRLARGGGLAMILKP